MGSFCSDTRKLPTCIPPNKRFSSSYEFSENIRIVSLNSAGNRIVDFERRKKNELRNVYSCLHPAHSKYYGHTKTRSIDRKIVALTERGTSQTLTISKLKMTRRRSCGRIGSSDDIFPISRPSWKMGSGETKSETSAISRSLSAAKVLKAKHIGAEINQEQPTKNDSVFCWENAANMKLFENGPLGETTSSQVPGEPKTQLVSDLQ